MPTYDYLCLNEACRHVQEEFHSITKTPEIRCALCNELMKRQIGAGGGILFRGGGFYATDYPSKNYRAAKFAENYRSNPANRKKRFGKET